MFLSTEDCKLVQNIFLHQNLSCGKIKDELPTGTKYRKNVCIFIHGMGLMICTWWSDSLSGYLQCCIYSVSKPLLRQALIKTEKISIQGQWICMFQECFPLSMETEQLHQLYKDLDVQGTERNAKNSSQCTEKTIKIYPFTINVMSRKTVQLATIKLQDNGSKCYPIKSRIQTL